MEAVSKRKIEKIAINFSFNSGTPMILLNVPPGLWVEESGLVITDDFDDPLATLEIGTVATPDLLLSALENAPSVIGDYFNDEKFKITLSEILRLTINPGTSTKGSGTVFLTIRR